MKRIVTLVLAALLIAAAALGASASGGNLNETGYPIVEEKITLTMMAPKSAIQGNWEDMWFFQHMEELTNIHMEFNLVPADSFQDKKNLAFASMSLPDLFYAGGITMADEVAYGAQGLLVPLNGLIDQYAPNLQACMERLPELRAAAATLDGNIYSLPKSWKHPQGQTVKYFINAEWLDNLGLAMPRTLDDLHGVLKAFVERDPDKNGADDTIGFGGLNDNDTNIDALVFAAFGLLEGSSDSFPLYSVRDGKVVLSATLPEYKQAIEYIKMLYGEKLIDAEYFTQTREQYSAKGAQLRYGLFNNADAYVVTSLDDSAKYKVMQPLVAREGQEQVWPELSSVTRGCAAITSANKYPEATMRWLDYTYSDEGGNLVVVGPEDMMWKWNEDRTAWISKEDLFKESGLNSWSAYKGAYLSPDSGGQIPQALDLDTFYNREDMHPIKRVYYDSLFTELAPFMRPVFPSLYFTEEEQMEISGLELDVKNYVKQCKAKFIIGDLSLDAFETDYLNTLRSMGLNRLLELQQISYDRYLANIGA